MTLPKRKPTRLREYDYSSPGAYFITICTYRKLHLFGKIKNGKMQLNDLGKIIDEEIVKIESHYTNVLIDKYQIMPNHIHMLVAIVQTERINPFPTIKYDIPNIIGKFKAGVTRRAVGDAFMHPEFARSKNIWQRSYHDHIIRDENDYREIWEYIDTNVYKWEEDCFYNNLFSK
ncbi:MAG: transposase [Clostridia bacterium]|nr:transposase [Clostridia bacterium]